MVLFPKQTARPDWAVAQVMETRHARIGSQRDRLVPERVETADERAAYGTDSHALSRHPRLAGWCARRVDCRTMAYYGTMLETEAMRRMQKRM